MVDAPAEATLPRLATERVARRPFTLSEYNHPAPNDFQAECVPMVAAWAAAQDWDAVWLFAWSHRQEDPARARFDTFFDIDQNPAKLGFMRAGAAIFRQAAIEPLPAGRPICLIGNGAPLDALAQLHQRGQQPWGGPDLTAVFRKDGVLDWTRMLTEKVAVTFDTNEIPVTAAGSTRTHVTWRVGDGGQGGLFLAEGLGARVLVRHGDTGQAVEAAGLRVVQPAFAALTVTALDGLPFEDTRLILVTACGRCENEAMGFSADRRTVGRDWGRAPVRVEPVEGTVALPSGRWRGWVLGPDGTPRADAVIGIMNTGMVMRIGGPLASMWYLAERQ
jgi:hypothetical protein